MIGGGDWSKDRLIPDCFKSWSKGRPSIIRNPNSTRPWQHVLEVVHGYMILAKKLSKNSKLHGQVFNFGPSYKKNYKVIEILKYFKPLWKKCKWKINRGWNGGSESYLTVFDSTADFVELDDCRVEGGQMTTFTSNSSIAQFDKTAYKGAKTLITIESDDGKVHMLEVTAICSASGTTAHATVTNSITSDNDLVDATVAVAANNINISLNKSSAATSSTSFTGRFTTTKVKV